MTDPIDLVLSLSFAIPRERGGDTVTYRCYYIQTWFQEPTEPAGTKTYRDGTTRTVAYEAEGKVVVWSFAS